SCIRFSRLSDVPAGKYAFSATVAIQVTNQMASQLRTAAVACELRPVSQSSPYGFDADRTAVTQFQFHTGDPGEGHTMHLDQQLEIRAGGDGVEIVCSRTGNDSSDPNGNPDVRVTAAAITAFPANSISDRAPFIGRFGVGG